MCGAPYSPPARSRKNAAEQDQGAEHQRPAWDAHAQVEPEELVLSGLEAGSEPPQHLKVRAEGAQNCRETAS